MTTNLDDNFSYYLNLDFNNYLEGEWIAIYQNKVISHNNSLKLVISEAKKVAPLAKVLISKIKKSASYL